MFIPGGYMQPGFQVRYVRKRTNYHVWNLYLLRGSVAPGTEAEAARQVMSLTLRAMRCRVSAEGDRDSGYRQQSWRGLHLPGQGHPAHWFSAKAGNRGARMPGPETVRKPFIAKPYCESLKLEIEVSPDVAGKIAALLAALFRDC